MKYRTTLLRLMAVVALIGGGMAMQHWVGNRQPAETAAVAPPHPEVAVAARLPTLMEFGMESCASCRAMQGQLDKLRARHPETLRVVTVNLKEQRALADQWRIRAMPTQILLDAEGQEIDRHLGFITAEAIRARFATAGLSLDGPEGRTP